ncbi:MAG: glycosyltransferase involved in cell wall biosynthesis [Zhongshania sp.]
MLKVNILFVLQCPWGADIGIAKVHLDLKEEYERLGHVVDVLAYDDIYPKGQSKFTELISPKISYMLHRKLCDISGNYDVIDANFQCVPYDKRTFGFKGLLVFRSHGLPDVYRRAEQAAVYQRMIMGAPKQPVRLRTRFGNIYRAIQRKLGPKELDASLRHADLVHCLNSTEYEYLLEIGIQKDHIVQVPNGVSDRFIEEVSKLSAEKRGAVVFLASWTPRKGIHDLNAILAGLHAGVGELKFKVLGSGYNQNYVFETLNPEFHASTFVMSHFVTSQLQNLLTDCRVGIFPSYIEGFGLAIVEQLACGVPVVAYDVPGPRDILRELDTSLLVEAGDIEAMVRKTIEIQSMPEEAYLRLSDRCKAHARQFKASRVAGLFLKSYEQKLRSLVKASTNSRSEPEESPHSRASK